MNTEYPKFTVIIPQKNRAEYIGHTLKTCMIQEYPNFEIIVSDDVSEDNSVAVVEELMKKDSRIKLFAHKQHLGMRDNFEFALSQVDSGYVIALGGDDGLVPGCIERMYEIIKMTGTDLLTWRAAGFLYSEKPGTPSLLMVPRVSNNQIKWIKSEDFLNRMAKTLWYQTNDCPMIYMKGVASLDIIKSVKSRTNDNSFYYCPTPDGFSGIVLAGEVEKYVYVDEPLSIVGTTTKSQGQNYGRTDETSKKEAQEFFNDNIRRTMHPELASQPYSPLITLMTADYLLTARDLPGWPGKFNCFTFDYLLKKAFLQISTTPYENEVLSRELVILRNIAVQHNLLDLYEELYEKIKRKKPQAKVRHGFAITHSYRFNGTQLGINNIYDACLSVNFAYRFCNMLSIRFFLNAFWRSFRIVLDKYKYSTSKLPAIKE